MFHEYVIKRKLIEKLQIKADNTPHYIYFYLEQYMH